MEVLTAELREILEGGNPRKLKTFQKIAYAGENRRHNKRRHKCQEDGKASLKKEEQPKGSRGWATPGIRNQQKENWSVTQHRVKKTECRWFYHIFHSE